MRVDVKVEVKQYKVLSLCLMHGWSSYFTLSGQFEEGRPGNTSCLSYSESLEPRWALFKISFLNFKIKKKIIIQIYINAHLQTEQNGENRSKPRLNERKT